MKTLFSAQIQFCRAAALVLALSAVGLIGCSDAPHDRVEAPGSVKMTTLPTPEKTATADAAAKAAKFVVAAPTESEMGMPVYPGAKPYTPLGGEPVKPLIDSSSATALLETPDALDKALDYYKTRIKEVDFRGNTVPVTPREEKDNGKRKVTLMGNDAEHNIQMVQLREENGKTVIQLMHANVKAAPASVSGGSGENKPGEGGTGVGPGAEVKKP